MSKVRILDSTVRDGGYMVDHHFSRLDLATLVGGLDRAGVPLIEVGHGNGVGSQLFKDPALRATSLPVVDDAGHAEVALRVAERAKVGVVITAGRRFVPIEYIDRIADLGFAFIRLAVMPDEVDDELFAYVRKVKDRGLTVSINMMQTYARTPAQVGELAARGAGHGLDWFFVVDSAGGLSPDEVKQYVGAIANAARVEVGFHGHNNLGLAVANCMAAVNAGATLIDGTLNGIGRATGNPPTEQLAVALRDRLTEPVDLDALRVLGNAIRPLFQDAGIDPLDVISGGARVHSRNVPKVLAAARARDRSPASFLVGVGNEARRRGTIMAMSYSEELYDAVAATTPAARHLDASKAMLEIASEELASQWHGGPRRAVEDLSLRSRQRHLESVVHVSRAAATLCARPVTWLGDVAGVTIPHPDRDSASWQVAPDRLPDYVLVDDGDPEPPIRGRIATWRIPFADIHARAVHELYGALRQLGVTVWKTGPRPAGAVAIVLGGDPLADTRLIAGDFVIATSAPTREQVRAVRQHGARLVQPKWTSSIAQAASSMIALHRELAGSDITDELDPTVLGELDDLAGAVRAASKAQLAAVLRGARRL